MTTDTPPALTLRLALPRGIWALGFVSMFMDISSEMIHALLPVYLVTVLGTSTLDGRIHRRHRRSDANITKIFSGALSDRLGKRKLLTTIGYGLAAFTKPIFPLATTVGWVVAARFIDRIGKGIATPLGTRSSPILRQRTCGARASACDSRSIRSAPLWGRLPRSFMALSSEISASCSGSRSCRRSSHWL